MTAENHKRNLEIIQGLCLMDDDFMKVCLDHKPSVEYVLRIILDKPDLVVTSVKTEYVVSNLQGRSVRLDVFAVDRDGKQHDIEIQRSDHGAGCKRARYNSALMDANALLKGEDFGTLPESYVIFITESDVIGRGRPVYRFDRCDIETGEPFGDGSHIVYVNGAWQGDDPIGILMRDFSSKKVSEMRCPVLKDRVRYIKENPEGGTKMCRAIEKLCEEQKAEGKKLGEKLGAKNSAIESAKRMLASGVLALEQIAQFAALPIEDVRKLQAQMG